MADDLDGETARPTAGFRYWYSAEVGAWSAPEYHVSFRQYSRRVQDYEYMSRTGGEGWNLAYGFTHITRTGREWFDSDPQPVEDVDWEHLAGTTSRVGGHPVNDETFSKIGYSLNFGRSHMAGGAGLQDGGTAGFVLLPTYGDFVAHKSLTFFPGGFLAVGSAISSEDSGTSDVSTKAEMGERPVHTTLLQWVAPTADEPLLVDGEPTTLSHQPVLLSQVNWCYIDGIGLSLPTSTDLWARREGRVSTVWIDHGTAPDAADYAYVVLPSTTVEQIRAFSQAPTVRVLHHSGAAHVVEDAITGSIAAILFAAGEAKGFTASAPAIIYQRGDGQSGAVVVQDPTHRTATLDITLPMAQMSEVSFVDEGLQLTARDDQLSIRMQPQLGRIYRAGWGERGRSTTSVPRVDLADFYAFRAQVESDPMEAIFTVHLADEPLRDGYELQLEGHKGHLIHIFSEHDVVDRPQSGTVRYRWRHDQRHAPAGEQREGATFACYSTRS